VERVGRDGSEQSDAVKEAMKFTVEYVWVRLTNLPDPDADVYSMDNP
jgi:hypothetical protein